MSSSSHKNCSYQLKDNKSSESLKTAKINDKPIHETSPLAPPQGKIQKNSNTHLNRSKTISLLFNSWSFAHHTRPPPAPYLVVVVVVVAAIFAVTGILPPLPSLKQYWSSYFRESHETSIRICEILELYRELASLHGRSSYDGNRREDTLLPMALVQEGEHYFYCLKHVIVQMNSRERVTQEQTEIRVTSNLVYRVENWSKYRQETQIRKWT